MKMTTAMGVIEGTPMEFRALLNGQPVAAGTAITVAMKPKPSAESRESVADLIMDFLENGPQPQEMIRDYVTARLGVHRTAVSKALSRLADRIGRTPEGLWQIRGLEAVNGGAAATGGKKD